MADEKAQISPYVQNIRDWKIREIISGYFDALLIFKNYKRSKSKVANIPFSSLRKICDTLWDVKENFHLIFKRVLNPKKKIFEQCDKLTPNDLEIELMNNIGILFHRVLIAREFKYFIDSYDVDEDGYEEAKRSLEINLLKIDVLFDQGINIILKILEKYQNNILLLTYFLENMAALKTIFKSQFETIISIFVADRKIEDIYVAATNYYRECGWEDRAKDLYKQMLKYMPRHKEAIQIIIKTRHKKR